VPRKALASLLLLTFAVLTGCAKKAALPVDSARSVGMDRVYGQTTLLPLAVSASVGGLSPAMQRFIAVRHKLGVISSEGDFARNWDAVIKFCGTIRCEVLSSNIVTRTQESTPSGEIVLRVLPEDFPKLLGETEKQGKVVQHTTESEDKTTQVVDTEARLKNLTAYRDSLRSMLGRSSLNIKDSVEVQEKLTDVQSELDAETTKRKMLANETEKIAVEIGFRVENPVRSRSAFAPLWSAFSESGEVLAESMGSLVTFIVAVIPWMLLIVPTVLWMVRKWRRYRLRRAAMLAAQTKS